LENEQHKKCELALHQLLAGPGSPCRSSMVTQATLAERSHDCTEYGSESRFDSTMRNAVGIARQLYRR
jgi:hypothetical protein